MKLEMALAKIRSGKGGTFRAMKPGEEICEGDIEFGLGYITDIRETHVGHKVQEGEAIIRLEFAKE